MDVAERRGWDGVAFRETVRRGRSGSGRLDGPHGHPHARDLSLAFGPAPVLADGVVHARARAPGRRRRAERHRQVDAAAGPRRAGRARRRVGHAARRRAPTVGYLPQEPDRRDRTRRWPTSSPAAPAWPPRDRAGAPPTAGARRRATPAPTTRYADALDRWLALGGADLDARAGRGAAPTSASTDARARPGDGHAVGRAGGPGLAGRHPAGPLRRLPARRAHQRPRLRRPRPARGVRRRPRRRPPWSSSATTGPSSSGSSPTCSSSTSTPTSARVFGGGWLAYLASKAMARRTPRRPTTTYRPSSGDARPTGPAPSGSGRSRASSKAEEDRASNDKSIRLLHQPHREAWPPRPGHREGARPARGRRQAVGGLGPPPRDRRRTPQRRRRRPPGRVPWSSGARSGSGPVDLEIGWAERVAIARRQRRGQDHAARRPPRPHRADRRASAGSVRASWSASSTRRRDRFADRPAAARRVQRRLRVCGRARPASLLAKFGLGADHVQRPSTPLSPGERTRAVLALLMAAGVNCLVLDEPTNHLDLPAIEQLEQALDALRRHASCSSPTTGSSWRRCASTAPSASSPARSPRRSRSLVPRRTHLEVVLHVGVHDDLENDREALPHARVRASASISRRCRTLACTTTSRTSRGTAARAGRRRTVPVPFLPWLVVAPSVCWWSGTTRTGPSAGPTS